MQQKISRYCCVPLSPVTPLLAQLLTRQWHSIISSVFWSIYRCYIIKELMVCIRIHVHRYCSMEQDLSGWQVILCCLSSDVEYAASFVTFGGQLYTFMHLLKPHLIDRGCGVLWHRVFYVPCISFLTYWCWLDFMWNIHINRNRTVWCCPLNSILLAHRFAIDMCRVKWPRLVCTCQRLILADISCWPLRTAWRWWIGTAMSAASVRKMRIGHVCAARGLYF